jgi:hypothetical protein
MNADTKPKLVSDEEQLSRLTRDEERDLERAEQELARAKTKGARDTARDKIAKIAARPKQRVTVTERRAALEETKRLARARGEEVNEKPEHGAAEIETRDGLKRMRKLGHLTEEQLRVGLIYRSAHEARGSSLKASQIGDSGGAGHDNDKFVMKALERAKLAEFVGKTDRAVALGCISNPSALQMLRHVAGEGGNVTDFGKGRALERNREGLSQALDIALRVWRDTVAQHRVSEAKQGTPS